MSFMTACNGAIYGWSLNVMSPIFASTSSVMPAFGLFSAACYDISMCSCLDIVRTLSSLGSISGAYSGNAMLVGVPITGTQNVFNEFICYNY